MGHEEFKVKVSTNNTIKRDEFFSKNLKTTMQVIRLLMMLKNIWARSCKNVSCAICAQQR